MLNGFNTLLTGGAGSGKTHALGSLLKEGITPFILFTENGMRTVGKYLGKEIHYKYVAPGMVPWQNLINTADKINTMTFKGLSSLPDIDKQQYKQFINVLMLSNNFICDCCGKEWGDVAEWNTDRAFCIDSLTGFSRMAMDNVVGGKPVRNQSDWGIAMGQIETALLTYTNNTRCHFILTSHLEREKDELTGAIQLMPSTLGQKLSPKIAPMFDDVILCQNREANFSWATVGINIDLKYRNLPAGKDLPASFDQLIKSWKTAGGIITPTKNS